METSGPASFFRVESKFSFFLVRFSIKYTPLASGVPYPVPGIRDRAAREGSSPGGEDGVNGRERWNRVMRFQPVDVAEKQVLVQRGKEVQKFREERQKLETHAAVRSADEPAKEFAPARVIIPRSPIVAQRAEELGKDRAPPKRHEAPEPDLKVQPKPKKQAGKRESPAKEPKEKKDKGKDKDKDKP